jgi:RNA polymerase sigma factor (sigma-70 family)
MAAGYETLQRYLRQLAFRGETDSASDAALLGRIVSTRDEAAFAAIMSRHGPLVLQVCRRILHNADDAEDAFQATFLVLARKVATVRPPEALSAWLHGVARRVALKARCSGARQHREQPPFQASVADPRPDPLAELSARELLALVDEEVQRLPQVYRLPVILCCLEGRSQEEAARQLGWTPGSVKGRLERGRARLYQRLVRRGLTLTAAFAAVQVSRAAVSAASTGPLILRTLRGALAFGTGRQALASGVSADATALAAKVIADMALARLKVAAALLLAGCLITTGFLVRTPTVPFHETETAATPPIPLETRLAPERLNMRLPSSPVDPNLPIEVSGMVVNPKGKPLSGASLYVGYSARHYTSDIRFRQPSYSPRATSGADGRFHFTFSPSELDPRSLDNSQPAIVAVAEGYAPDWAEIHPGPKGTQLTLSPVEDRPLNGRILDQSRKPVAGARIVVHGVIGSSDDAMARFFSEDIDPRQWYPKSWRGAFPGQAPSITTDDEGRFRLAGCGDNRIVSLTVEGPSIHHTAFDVTTRPSVPPSKGILPASFDYVAAPSRSIRGVVRDKATGRPLAGVKMTERQSLGLATSDSDGCFEIHGCPKLQNYLVVAQPQIGQILPHRRQWLPRQTAILSR